MRARVRAGVCVVVCAQCVPLGLLEIEMDLGSGVVVGAVVAVVVGVVGVVVAVGGVGVVVAVGGVGVLSFGVLFVVFLV